jgi:gag-polypeptide of LTR copia-type
MRPAWKTLTERYEPKSAVDKQTLFEQLKGMKLEDVSKDPEIWIIELQRILSKLSEMGKKVSDGLLMCHILDNLHMTTLPITLPAMHPRPS